MPRYCHNPPLGTTPNAKIRIRTPCASAPCGSVAKIAAKMSKKCDQRAAGALRVGFSLILGLAKRSSYWSGRSRHIALRKPADLLRRERAI